jgi:hypothetical protein
MDVETLFSGRYGVDGVASPYPVCLSLPAISGIKGTNGAPTHIVAHTSVIAGLPTLVPTVQAAAPVGQRNSRSTQGWSIMETAAFHHRKAGHGYKGLGTVAKAPVLPEYSYPMERISVRVCREPTSGINRQAMSYA